MTNINDTLDNELHTLTIEDLAHILKKSVRTIKNDVSRAPERLPPRLKIPGSDKVLWRANTVRDWLASHDSGCKDEPIVAAE